MFKSIIQRSYNIGWYSLSEKDAINGLVSHLSERAGIKDITVHSCTPNQLSGDKGYNISVSYKEDLDETFGFPEELNKVIFLDTDSYRLPFMVENVARETKAGIVITTPELKDEYYNDGYYISPQLLELMEQAHQMGVEIVGITPSISGMKEYGMSSSEMMAHSIKSYLKAHPSIERYVVVNKEDIQELAPNVFVGHDMSWNEATRAKEILNVKTLTK